jgi:succinate-semialdehyde dehydrogenase/glutarate-semialdehyde dehydrogenase
MAIATIDPRTGEVVERFDPLTADEIEAKLAAAEAAFRSWRRTSSAERAALLVAAAERFEDGRERWGRLMALEMGKPLAAGIAEAEKCGRCCRHYAEHAAAYLAAEPVAGIGSRAYVRFDPLGPVLAVMPWNFPFWQVVRFAAPALAAGNVALLKHASNVPCSALALEEIFANAGFPAGCFQTLLVGAETVGALIADRRVAAVTVTGSEGAGVAVGEAAGRSIKKVVLELGGSDPFVVLASADLERAGATAVQARTLNSGQSCIAAKRFLFHESVFDEMVARLVSGMAALKVGDPMEPGTAVGPMATRELRDQLAEQVDRSVAAGARCVLGGEIPAGPGSYYPPTVLVDPLPGSPAWEEELFGPVATVFRVRDLEHAIALANDSRFGLAASVWTRDPAEVERLTAEIEAGSVFVNAMVQSDPRLPFGGIKRSGHGRELSVYGIREFVNVKSVVVA